MRTGCEGNIVFVSKMDDIIGDWKKLHNEELRNVYSSPNITTMIKSRTVRWAGHVVRMGRRGVRI
jgi:hypothetical protein